jgi:hypothetical protein
MTTRRVPFSYGMFYHGMVHLIGRDPDVSHRWGMDGRYTFRYEPRDDAERRRLGEASATLTEWLRAFDLIPLESRCDFGRLPHPQPDEEDKEFLVIEIAHPVERQERERPR